jgi:hypothetical protein
MKSLLLVALFAMGCQPFKNDGAPADSGRADGSDQPQCASESGPRDTGTIEEAPADADDGRSPTIADADANADANGGGCGATTGGALDTDASGADDESGTGTLVVNGGLPMPVAYWSLDDADIVRPHAMADRVGGFDGLYPTAGRPGIPGVIGQAYEIPPNAASSGAIIVPPRNNDPLELQTAGTLSVWASPEYLPSDLNGGRLMAIVDKGGFGTDLTILARPSPDPSCSWIVSFLVATDFQIITEVDSTQCMTTRSVWYHIVATFTGPGQACLYLDGALQNCARVSNARPGDIQPLKFGDGAYFTSRLFIGKFDEVAIWNIPLSGDQVQTLHDMNVAGVPLIGNPQ